MKLLPAILLAALLFTDLDKIGQINTIKSEAKKAYLGGDYKTAIEKYRFLVDSLGVKEDEVLMNLANAYFESQDTTHTFNSYQTLSQSQNKKLSSLANQQLGVLENRQGKFEEALNHFKQAMKADPENEDARYNYELVKKKLEEKKKQEQQQNKDNQNKDDKKDQQNKDQDKNEQNKNDQNKQDKEKKDDKNKENQDKEQQEKEKQEKEKQQKEQEQKDKDNQEKKDLPPNVSEKLKDMQISEDKAKMILEAMKNQEIQYLQQNKRKATKPRDKGKPDW